MGRNGTATPTCPTSPSPTWAVETVDKICLDLNCMDSLTKLRRPVPALVNSYGHEAHLVADMKSTFTVFSPARSLTLENAEQHDRREAVPDPRAALRHISLALPNECEGPEQ